MAHLKFSPKVSLEIEPPLDELSAAAHATEMETMDVVVEFVLVDYHHG